MHRRLGLLVAVLALVASACGGGDDDTTTKTSKAKRAGTTTTSAAVDATTTSGAPGASPSTLKGSATTARGSTGTTAKPGGTTPPTADPNAAPAPAATGTYNYAQSGSTSEGPVPPNGTLQVSGGSSQLFRRDFDPSDGVSDFDLSYVFRGDGPFITRAVARENGVEIVCNFGSPVPAPPWPPTPGRTFSGKASCSAGLTADFSGRITGNTTDTVGGTRVDAVVISSTLHIYNEDRTIDLNINDTQHWAPSLRVPTYSHEVVSGSYTVFGATRPVSGDVTSRLKSTSPS